MILFVTFSEFIFLHITQLNLLVIHSLSNFKHKSFETFVQRSSTGAMTESAVIMNDDHIHTTFNLRHELN